MIARVSDPSLDLVQALLEQGSLKPFLREKVLVVKPHDTQHKNDMVLVTGTERDAKRLAKSLKISEDITRVQNANELISSVINEIPGVKETFKQRAHIAEIDMRRPQKASHHSEPQTSITLELPHYCIPIEGNDASISPDTFATESGARIVSAADKLALSGEINALIHRANGIVRGSR